MAIFICQNINQNSERRPDLIYKCYTLNYCKLDNLLFEIAQIAQNLHFWLVFLHACEASEMPLGYLEDIYYQMDRIWWAYNMHGRSPGLKI